MRSRKFDSVLTCRYPVLVAGLLSRQDDHRAAVISSISPGGFSCSDRNFANARTRTQMLNPVSAESQPPPGAHRAANVAAKDRCKA